MLYVLINPTSQMPAPVMNAQSNAEVLQPMSRTYSELGSDTSIQMHTIWGINKRN